MLRQRIAPGIVAALSVLTIVGCSTKSPVAPSGGSDSARSIGVQAAASAGPQSAERATVSQDAQAVPGSYVLSFVDASLQPVSQLPVGDGELVLKAHVDDSFGNPARAGAAVFDYCSYKRLPPKDITRADEAPKEACETGTANWKPLRTVELNQTGDAYLNFGVVLIPRTVGFRFRYAGQGSGIANGVSAPGNFTWIAR